MELKGNNLEQLELVVDKIQTVQTEVDAEETTGKTVI